MPRNRDTAGSFMSTATLMQPKRPPTPDEGLAIAEVHELVDRFAAGMTTTAEIRAATSGKQRWLATRFTESKDRLFAPLMRMLDALIADEGKFETKHGSFEPDDFFPIEAQIVREDGRELVQFPYVYPPRYRRPEERGAIYGSFSVKPPTQVKPYEPQWWESDATEEEVPF